MATPEQWFKNMPVITKTWFVASVTTTALVSFGLLDMRWIYLDLHEVFYRFQIWQLFTNFLFFGKFSLGFVFQMFLMVRYTSLLEETYFVGNRGTADMTFMMLFGGAIMILVSYFISGLYFLAPCLSFMLLYYWSRKDPYRPVSFWGFVFQAWQFPFVMVAVSVLIGASPLLDLVGIVVGHIFHFLVDIVPRVYNRTVLKTPEFFYTLFDQHNVHGRAQSWRTGTGYRLG